VTCNSLNVKLVQLSKRPYRQFWLIPWWHHPESRETRVAQFPASRKRRRRESALPLLGAFGRM